jgi:integrase
MAIFKRGRVYWYHFWFDNEHIQESTKQRNPRTARQIEAAHKTALAKGEVGIRDRKPVPAFVDFAEQFKKSVRTKCADKPSTVQFYENKLARLLEFTPVAQARLDRIDEALIDSYVQHRRESVSPASVNRELATLRKALRLAHEWRIIDRVPRIRLLAGERVRDFVLSHEQEQLLLANAPQPLADFALLAVDTGLRVSEVLALQWPDVHFAPVNGARLGYLHVRKGKSRNARRNLSLTPRVRTMLESRAREAMSVWAFTNEEGTEPLSVYTLEDQHSRVRKNLGLRECVIHSFRHTFGTRLGEAGADAFTIMRAMGHSSVTVSQKYVHPTPETMERAFERLNAMNEKAIQSLLEGGKRQLPATVFATVIESEPEPAAQVL